MKGPFSGIVTKPNSAVAALIIGVVSLAVVWGVVLVTPSAPAQPAARLRVEKVRLELEPDPKGYRPYCGPLVYRSEVDAYVAVCQTPEGEALAVVRSEGTVTLYLFNPPAIGAPLPTPTPRGYWP